MALRKGTNLNDSFSAGAGGEDFDGLKGYDLVSYGSAKSAVGIDLLNAAANAGAAAGDTFTSIEAFRLTKFNDSFDGSAAADSVNGGLGNDDLNGRGGNDQLSGHLGNDTLYGAAGNDGLWGGAGADTLYGGAGNDLLRGDSGNDTLAGDAGNDVIDGGAGSDTVFGGAGADTFVFSTASGTDDIRDFELGTDHIKLAAQYWDGNMANGEAVITDFYGVASMIRLTDNSADGYVDNTWLYIGNNATTSSAALHTAMSNGTLFVV